VRIATGFGAFAFPFSDTTTERLRVVIVRDPVFGPSVVGAKTTRTVQDPARPPTLPPTAHFPPVVLNCPETLIAVSVVASSPPEEIVTVVGALLVVPTS